MIWPMLRMQVLVEQRIFWRNRSTTFFTFVLPLALLLVLGVSSDPVEHVPFIIALGVLSTAFQGLAIQLSMHRDQGVLKQVMAGPLPAWLLVLGKVLSAMLVILLETVIVVTVGVAAFGAPRPEDPVALVAFALLGTATFVALGFAMASIIPGSDAAPAIVNAVYLALILVTALMLQLETMPDAVRMIGGALPLEHLYVPIQHAWLEGLEPSDGWSIVVLVLWGLAGAVWTVRRFRWEPVEQR